MSNSAMASYTGLSPNHSGQRTHEIDRITPHCVVGQLTAEGICGCFSSPSSQASCNYGIGLDGKVAICVEEKNRSWCSSSRENDQRAVTIEVASGTREPYEITAAAYESLVALMADICRRNGKTRLTWDADRDRTLAREPEPGEMVVTVHRWFKNKACPGTYIYERLGQIAAEVNKRLGGGSGAGAGAAGKADAGKPDGGKATGGKADGGKAKSLPEPPFEARVLVPDLNYRSEPSMSGKALGQTGVGTFTVTQVSGEWGKLKSGAGWIYLGNPEYVSVGKADGGKAKAKAKPQAGKTVDEVAREVLAGKWGDGEERKRRLRAAGYNYGAVQARVNALLK